jgi:hypothetical protein
MTRMLALVAATAICVSAAQAGEVFISRDAQGRPVYTDRPESLPAEKLKVTSKPTDPAEVQRRYDEQMKAHATKEKAAAEASQRSADGRAAAELDATDKAKRCQEARARYQNLLAAQRLYDEDDSGERRYLSAAEIDTARANAKRLMDEFCNGT